MRWSSALFLAAAHALTGPRRGANRSRRAPLAAAGSGGAGGDGFFPELQERVDELRSRQTALPIVVLDSMLPGQRLTFSSADDALREMLALCACRAVEEAGEEQYSEGEACGAFGMVGIDRLSGKASAVGVEAVVLSVTDKDGSLFVDVRGGRIFSVDEEKPASKQQGGFFAREITFAPNYDAEEEAAAANDATVLAAMVDTWERLVVEGGHERVPNHIELVRGHLGKFPKRASDRAFWVGALINPLPGLGVALEIRPALLYAQTARERVAIAVEGVRGSIAHLSGSKRLW
ncbi:hypothetical protein M885DRAFT_506140 [Pelagophyceae sp. CCMP2097]|nr:hypothetical protein M885DRAFT_506140 [Pelagophyceae sp. CCMP2097]